MDALARQISQVVLSKSGLTSMLERMKEYETHGGGGKCLAEDSSTSLSVISQSLRAFFELISSPDALPEFSEIIDVDIKNGVTLKMGMNLVNAYEHIYKAVCIPENGYGSKADVLSHIEHSPEEVKTVLSIK